MAVTLEEFRRCAQIQDNFLYTQGCHKPKEMIINPTLRKRLNLGSSVVLDHCGEVPLVDEPSIALFMFRGYTYDPMQDNPCIVVEKGRSVGRSELCTVDQLLAIGDLKETSACPVPKVSVPMSQRKRARR